MQNLVSLICPSLQILGKTQIWVISGNPLYRKIAVPVEQDNVKKKKKKMTSHQQIAESFPVFGFMTNLEQSETRIPDA